MHAWSIHRSSNMYGSPLLAQDGTRNVGLLSPPTPAGLSEKHPDAFFAMRLVTRLHDAIVRTLRPHTCIQLCSPCRRVGVCLGRNIEPVFLLQIKSQEHLSGHYDSARLRLCLCHNFTSTSFACRKPACSPHLFGREWLCQLVSDMASMILR